MKKVLSSVWEFVKKYYFLPFAVITLVLPDMMLKGLVGYASYSEKWANVVSNIFIYGWILLAVYFTAFVLPKNWGRIVFIVYSGFFLIFSFCEYVYFTIFGQFFWLKSIGLAGEGADYLAFATGVIERRLLLYVFFIIASLVIACIGWKRPNIKIWKASIFLVVPISLLVGAHIYMDPDNNGGVAVEWDAWRKPRQIYSYFSDSNKSFQFAGLYQYTFRDMYKTIFDSGKVSDEDIRAVDEYLEKKPYLTENEFSGMFKGKNVICVMMESMDTWLITEKYTPTIYQMMEEGINFTAYNPPLFGSGYTFGSEFAFNTGLYTPASAVTAANFSKNSFPYSVANMFRKNGYTANSFHFNHAEFYNRGVMHKSLGYETYNTPNSYGIGGVEAELDTNLLKNADYAALMTKKTPFMDFIITYSAHLPYTSGDKINLAKSYYPELVDEKENPEKNNAQILAADTDMFFKKLLEKLEAEGLLENTVIVAFTDHYTYGVSDTKLLDEWKTEPRLTVPAFIWAKGIEPMEIDKPMKPTDWLPTIVNLFGLGNDVKFMGDDMLDPENPGFAFTENRVWMVGDIYFDPATDTNESAYIKEQSAKVEEYIRMNDIIVIGDYYKNR
ncbi:MAG: sulfatase-like hydrolase/transferase [Clostridia bacterium]|nr:sulfatase-like hydrolase/transferase [Clostridia bacterium]